MHEEIRKARPLALIILDGWGYREEIEANAIAQAKKPFWDKIWEIEGSGLRICITF